MWGVTDVEAGLVSGLRTSCYAVSNWRWMWSGVESDSLSMTLTD